MGLSEAADGDETAQAYAEYLNGVDSDRARQTLPYLFWLRGLPLDEAREATVSALGADALRQRIAQAVADLLASATTASPAVVCVEDAHWADPSSVELLRVLAADDAMSHVLFVLTSRPDSGAASRWIQALAEDDRRVVDLAPLSDRDSRLLLDQAFSEDSTPELIDEVRTKAQGNPLYLASLLRSLVDSGMARLVDGRLVVGEPSGRLAIPDTLQEVIGAQIDRLPALAKQVLHWATILGNAFAPRDVAQIAHAEGMARDIADSLSLLCQRQLLQTDTDERLHFVHALVRDVGYEQMLERERRRLHGVAARIIEEQVGHVEQPSEAQVALLAWHYERAAECAEASLRYEQAAAIASNSHAHAEELGYLESAIRLADLADGHRLARLTESAADAMQLLGRYEEAAERYSSLVGRSAAAAAIDMARLHRKIARTFTPRMAGDDANRAIEEARRWLLAAKNSADEAWWREHFAVELFAMWALYMQGHADGVAELAASLASEIDEHATKKERALFHRNVALLRLRQQRYRPDAATVELAALAAAEMRECGDATDLCLTTFTHAFTQLWIGAVEEADRSLHQVLEDTVRLGDAERNLLCLVYLAVTSRKLGNVDSAEAFAKAAIARARANRSLHYEAVSHGNLGWVAWRRGDAEQADRFVELATRTLFPAYPFSWIYAAVGVARAVERSDLAAAVTHTEKMIEDLQQRLDPEALNVFQAAIQSPSLATMHAVVEACRKVRYL